MEARNGGRAYVKKPVTGIMPKTTKATSSNSSNKGNNQANNNKKGAANAINGGKKKGPGLHVNGNEKNEKNEGNGLKKSKEVLPPIEKAAVVPDKKEAEQEEEEDLTCLICCELIDFFSAGECEHRFVCSQCTLRRRALYKEWQCCICKVQNDQPCSVM
jgi:hypothetical protein